MRNLFSLLLCMTCLSCVPFITSGCHSITLAPGGVYTDPYLAKTDRAILDADSALTGFVTWQSTNATYLAKWPEIGALAQNISANKNQWIKDAYAARDSYASASAAYKSAIAAGSTSATPASTAKVEAALAVIDNITAQINAYRAAHHV